MKNKLLSFICSLIGHDAELTLGTSKALHYSIKCARCNKMIMDTSSKEHKKEINKAITESKINWDSDINPGKDQ